jgi:hypothetical protein
MSKIELKIGAEEIIIDTDEETLITDLSTDMEQIAARISRMGSLLAASERERDQNDARYRKWRASVALQKMKKDQKIAEWKVKASIEETERFEQFKMAASQCTYNCTALYNLIVALREKSQILRSLGATARAELESTGQTTRMSEAQQTAYERKEQIRGLKKKKQ